MNRRNWITMAGIGLIVVGGLSFGGAVFAQTPDTTATPATTSTATTTSTQLPCDGTGRGAGLRGLHDPALSPVTIAAEVMGIERDALLTELQSGKTIADVAAERNISLESIIEAIVSAHSERLTAAVSAGTITQAQADAAIERLRSELPDRLTQPLQERGPRGDGAGRPNRPGRGNGNANPTQTALPGSNG